jgi:hypothetical protein
MCPSVAAVYGVIRTVGRQLAHCGKALALERTASAVRPGPA